MTRILINAFILAAFFGSSDVTAEQLDIPRYSDVLAKLERGHAIDDRDLGSLDKDAAAQLFLHAVTLSESDAARALLDAGLSPDTVGEGGWTPLLMALLAGKEETALLLLDAGADPTLAAEDGTTAADLAELIGSRAVLWALARAEGGPEAGRLVGLLASLGDIEGLDEAIGAGIDVDMRDGLGWTPLLHATANGQHDAIRYLLNAGADPNLAAPDGSLPLAMSILAGDQQAFATLIADVTDPNGRVAGIPLLNLAVVSGNHDMIDPLLEAGADPGAADDEGATAAQLAQVLGLNDLVRRLGGDPDGAINPPGPEDLLRAVLDDDAERVEDLIVAGIPVDVVFDNGWRPLHVAAEQGNAEVIKRLLESGADPATKNPAGDNSLMLLLDSQTGKGKASSVRAIFGSAQDQSALLQDRDSQGRTVFMRAALNDDILFINSIRASISNRDFLPNYIDQPDNNRIRPLTAAVLLGHTNAVIGLKQLGASDRVNGETMSAQDIARDKALWRILAILPDDRVFDFPVRKGMGRDDRRRLQAKLQEWGYYNGAIDGILGAGSAAAMRAFLEDRRREIISMAELTPTSGRWHKGYSDSWSGPRTCRDDVCREWWAARWENGQQFVGYSGRHPPNNGFGLYTWSDENWRIFLLGAGGWNDREEIF